MNLAFEVLVKVDLHKQRPLGTFWYFLLGICPVFKEDAIESSKCATLVTEYLFW